MASPNPLKDPSGDPREIDSASAAAGASGAPDAGELVIYVHGLWMSGLEFMPLAKRLEGRGFRSRTMLYSTTLRDLEGNAAALLELVRASGEPVCHLVGHSLGGLVIQRALELGPELPPGRCVFLGSPVGGSRAGRSLGSVVPGRWVLGRAHGVFEQRTPRWTSNRELLLVAGTGRFGFGHAVARLAGPNDGTVLVEETRMAGANAHVTVPLTHTALPFSRRVAVLVGDFLADGTVNAAADGGKESPS